MGKEHAPNRSNVSHWIGRDFKSLLAMDFPPPPPKNTSEFYYENNPSETQAERMDRCNTERQAKDAMHVGPKGADDIAMQTHMRHLGEQYECSSGKK